MGSPRRKYRSAWIIPLLDGVLVLGFGAASGCAGPTTPLGAIWDLHPRWNADKIVEESDAESSSDSGTSNLGAAALGSLSRASDEAPARKSSVASRGLASALDLVGLGASREPKIQFDPPRQWLHGAHGLKVIVDDPRGVHDDYGLTVRYHGHDVTRSFLMQARVSRSEGGSRLTIEVPAIRLSPMAEHLIEVGYSNPDSGTSTVTRLRSPLCQAFDHKEIQNFDEFRPDPELTHSIDAISRKMGFNPAFTAALIAQESAFNPHSVSFSRALGLTQVTALAEEEVTGAFPLWPRYPGINELPAPAVKWLVFRGEVNAANEWRLNPERSIQGGLAFAQKLADRWSDSEGLARVSTPNRSAREADLARTRLILASYNSGYARVLQAINHYGPAWLGAPELKEARKYVNRIFSYCDAFGQESSEAAAPVKALQGHEWPEGPDTLPPALIQKVMNENKT